MESSLSTLLRPDLSWNDKVAYLAWKMRSSPEHQEVPVEHRFYPGVYVREMWLPAGIIFIGRPHTKGHFCELVSGKLIMFTDKGPREFEAPHAIMSEPGFQMVVRTLTPCLGRTIHRNPEENRDTAELELEAFLPAEPILARGEQIALELRGLLE